MLRAEGKVPIRAQADLDEGLVNRGYFLPCQAKVSEVERIFRPGGDVLPSFRATLKGTRYLATDVLEISLNVPGWKNAPGRFIYLNHSNGVRRTYSIATAYGEPADRLVLHARLLPSGEMSGLLANAKSGDKYCVEGPLGKCRYRPEDKNAPILMIGSGTGLAPLYSLATQALARGHLGDMTLYHGAASPDRLYLRSELTELDGLLKNFRYVACADSGDEAGVRIGSPLDFALSDHTDLTRYCVYLCGHPCLVRAAQKKCFLAGADLKNIFADPFEPFRS